ncbi:Chromatin remodeling complex subunit [Corchorus olitorius]|uniref:Chromatin remodeling complex subunit n=1 Tax=Corchorus olitorius TaxID=93759 RepID=A0A1R3KT34_9ROSI|nr:Chromatin remodeling complex subunit [Corchorus olitorius]
MLIPFTAYLSSYSDLCILQWSASALGTSQDSMDSAVSHKDGKDQDQDQFLSQPGTSEEILSQAQLYEEPEASGKDFLFLLIIFDGSLYLFISISDMEKNSYFYIFLTENGLTGIASVIAAIFRYTVISRPLRAAMLVIGRLHRIAPIFVFLN